MFPENYRLYARSHFVKAIELGLILIFYAACSALAKGTFFYTTLTISSWFLVVLILIFYAACSPLAKGTFFYTTLTISSWFLVVSWIMAPSVFNPSVFDWLKTMDDFDNFMNWICNHGGVFARAEQSWENGGRKNKTI